MNREKLEKIIEESLHIDWAFKDVHGKPDKIIIEGYPKGAYHIGYDEFVKRISQAFKSYMAEVIGERDLEIQAVKNAFTVKGVNPEYHDKIKRQLAVEWPTLYYALESLTYSAGLSQPATSKE